MNAFLPVWTEKWNALNTRERWMVFFAGLAVIYFLLNALLVSPATGRHTLLATEVAQARQQLQELQQQMTTLAESPLQDVDAANKAKIADLNATLLTQSQALQALSDTLVSPELMPKLLQDVMRRHADIRLVNMKTLPPVNFIHVDAPQAAQQEGTENTEVKPEFGVYQHGLELTLSGHYMALMKYAEALQGLSKQVLWDKAELVAKDYPASELTVTVYTLSLDKTWLSI